MQIIKIILSVIFIIDCIALTVVVLMQEGKQQGLGAIAGAAETYWGKNKGRSMEGGLVKATTIMGTLFFVISVALNMLGLIRKEIWKHSCYVQECFLCHKELNQIKVLCGGCEE